LFSFANFVACNGFANVSHEVEQQHTENDTEGSVPSWTLIYLLVIRQTKGKKCYVERLKAYIKDEDTTGVECKIPDKLLGNHEKDVNRPKCLQNNQ
jgi:hypothetical protein